MNTPIPLSTNRLRSLANFTDDDTAYGTFGPAGVERHHHIRLQRAGYRHVQNFPGAPLASSSYQHAKHGGRVVLYPNGKAQTSAKWGDVKDHTSHESAVKHVEKG